jgi:hypothetical protein
MDSLSDKAAKLWSNIVSRMDGAKGGKYKSMPDNVFRAWNGEYYTDGTAPPEPEPEPEEEEEDETHGWSDGESDTKEPDPNAPSPAPEGE